MPYYKSIRSLLDQEFNKILLLLVLFLCLSIVDLMSIGLIGAYIGVLLDPGFIDIMNPYPSLEFLIRYSHAELIIVTGIILLLIFIIKFIFLLFSNYFIISFAASEQAKTQKLLINGLLSQSYENFLASKSGDTIASIANFSGTYKEVLQAALQVCSNIIVIIAVCIFLAIASFTTLISLVTVMGLIFGLYNFIFAKRILKYGKAYLDGASDMIQGTTEISNGLKEIKTLGREEYFMKSVSDSVDAVTNSSIKITFLSLIPRNVIELMLILFIVCVVAINIGNTSVLTSTLSMLGLFAAGMVRITPLVSQVQTSWNTIGYGKEAVMALSTIISNQQAGEIESTPSEPFKDHLQNNVFDTLVLKNVSYNYPGSDQKSISGLSLKIEKGDFIGLIGPSGAGKTSLVNLILGFLKPETGSIEFNKSDIYKNLPFWRARCAYLPQDIFLINTSLKENITLEKNFTDSNSLSKAIKLSRLSKHIESLPEGIETNIGDRGARLSGGQRQRVAIARAIYHQRDLLILDESTSALDSITEKEVMHELIGLRKEKTIIAIAHRISTLKECNKIFKLNAGIIEGPFSYDEISQEN